MAIELATAYVSLVPTTKGFSKNLESQLKGVGSSIGAQVGGDIGGGIESGLGTKVASALKSIGAMAVKTGLVIGAGGAALGTWGLKNAADMQQTEIAFEGIFGSASAANAFLGELKKFAAATPFEFPELANASKQLLAVGFSAEQVIPTMTKIGNVAATLGVGSEGINSVVRALGQMKGKGKASAEELQQIAEAIPGFVPVQAIAEKLGVTTAEAFALMAKGAVPADLAIEAIIEGMEKFPGAAGAMERQSQTLAGVFSTLKDTVSQALVGGIGPALPALADSINQAMPAIGQAIGSFGKTFGNVLTSVTPLLDTLLPVITKIADIVSGVFGEAMKALTPAFQALAPHIGNIAKILGGAFLRIIKALAPSLPVLADALGKIAEVVGGVLASVLEAIAPTLGKVAGILGGAMAKAAKVLAPVLEKVGNVLAGAFVTVLKALEPVLPDLADAFVQIAVAMADILVAITPLIPPIAKLAALLIREIGAPTLVLIARAFATMASAIADLVGFVASLVGHLGDLGGLFSSLGEAISTAASKVGGFFSELPGKILGWLGDVASTLWNKGVDLITGLLGGIWQKALDLAKWYMNLYVAVLGWIGDVARSLWQKGVDFITGLLGGIWEKAVDLADWFIKLPGKIIGWIGDIAGRMEEVGKNIILGVWEGIKKLAGWFKDKVVNFFGDIWDSITGVFDIGSPSKRAAWAGKMVVVGMAQGLEHNAGIVQAAARRTFTGLLPDAAPAPINVQGASRPVISDRNLQTMTNVPALAGAGSGVQFGDTYITEASRPREVANEVLALASWKLNSRGDG